MHEKWAFLTMFLEGLLAALLTMSSKVPYDGFLNDFSRRLDGVSSGVFPWGLSFSLSGWGGLSSLVGTYNDVSLQ